MNANTDQRLPLRATFAEGAPGAWEHALALAILFALCAFPSLYHGIARDVLANSDMDLVSVYQALLINAGQPLVPNAHTGYVYFLSLAGWFQVFDWLGMVSVHDMNGLLAATNFDTTYGALVIAGRWFSVVQAWILVGLVYGSISILLKKQSWGWWASLLLGAVFAIGGGGIAAQSVMLRTELSSMILIFAAALALMAAPRATLRRGCWLLGLSGFLIHAALMVKIQNVIVIIFLPLLPLVFGWWERRDLTKMPPQKLMWTVPVVAVILAAPVAVVFTGNLAPGSHGLYQGLIAIFVISCALIFGRWHLGAARYGVVGLGAVAIGFSLAYGLSFFNDNWWTTFSVVNFLEQMSLYSPAPAKAAASPDGGGAIANVARSIASGFSMTEVIRFVTERLRNFDYPFAIFYILVPAGAFVLALQGKWEAATKAGFLCLMAGMIVAIFWVGRGFFNFYYSVYVETWVILAAAIVLRELAQMIAPWPRHWLRAGQAGMLILILAVVTVNVRFRLLDPAAANPIVAKSSCFIRGLTPLFYTNFDNYCAKG
ncbi:MAG: hypothetical protein HQ494_08995 [Rhodospirillales bacterium]|nr:hypothetical protein [Rhodospirillales bacterium]